MSHGFEIYEGTATESADVARITVRKGGLMVLTRAAVNLLGEHVTHVQLDPVVRSRMNLQGCSVRDATLVCRVRFGGGFA